MTITGTPPSKTIGNPPPVPPRRAVVAAAAGLIVVAAVSITPWLLPNGSRTETNSIEPTSAAARRSSRRQLRGTPMPVRTQAAWPAQQRTSGSALGAPASVRRPRRRWPPAISSFAGTARRSACCRNATNTLESKRRVRMIRTRLRHELSTGSRRGRTPPAVQPLPTLDRSRSRTSRTPPSSTPAPWPLESARP
jgi:hypothetical protein